MIEECTRISGDHLADFDWKVTAVLASNKAASLRVPLLQLALYVKNSDGDVRENLVELDKSELDKLIDALKGVREGMKRIPY